MSNPYFNEYNDVNQQSLLEDLKVEVIEMYGTDCYYLPKRFPKLDSVYMQDDTAFFDKAYPLTVYVQNFGGFQGERDMMSKFNTEIRDQVYFELARLSFQIHVGKTENFSRPRDGDLIYFAMNKKCFEIRYVDNKEYFYVLGDTPSYQLSCELFEYSMEKFNTGIKEIDSIEQRLSVDILGYVLRDGDNNYLVDHKGNYLMTTDYNTKMDEVDPLQDNAEFQRRANQVIEFTTMNPWCIEEGEL